jgi:hypothetical protein
MFPVGVAFIALDIPPLSRRLLAWATPHGAAAEGGDRSGR